MRSSARLSFHIGRLDVMLAVACVLICSGMIGGCHSEDHAPKASVEITGVPPATAGGPEQMDAIEGRVRNAKPGQQMVIYTKNGPWWVQPFANYPFTAIAGDGTWKASIHLGTDYAALLVDQSYQPQMKLAGIPTLGNGVVAEAEMKGAATGSVALKTLHFSGYDWVVRSAPSERGGEMNAYDPGNAWTDEKGYLHLRTGQKDGHWSCAEVNLTRSLGYGTYRFVVRDSAHLPDSAVLGIFTLDERLGGETRVEMDIELSQWGRAGDKNAQYVVQPYYIPENIVRFAVPAGEVTHILRWEPGTASFKSVSGAVAGVGTKSIREHVFASGIPTAAGETVHFDLFDFFHSKSTSQRPAEVVIEKFEYLP